MLACGIAALLAKRITYGSIYTTKLLRRGIDIERPKALGALQALSVEEVMQPLNARSQSARLPEGAAGVSRPVQESLWERLVGPVTLRRRPQALFAEEDLEQVRRQLVLYGRDGLPVVSHDGQLRGWLTRADLLKALTTKLNSGEEEIAEGAIAAEFALENPSAAIHTPNTPLRGYEILELRITAESPARGHRVAEIEWPPDCVVAAVTQGREIHAGRPELELQPGERVIVLAPAREERERGRPSQTKGTTPSQAAGMTELSVVSPIARAEPRVRPGHEGPVGPPRGTRRRVLWQTTR
ncbi:MAG: hypothetical protein JO243_21355 [Solirubrobacterales bacterium]|nr:hypothetical protein [Solirubrobacterales bacterium]